MIVAKFFMCELNVFIVRSICDYFCMKTLQNIFSLKVFHEQLSVSRVISLHLRRVLRHF